jgi:hypothetical protein
MKALKDLTEEEIRALQINYDEDRQWLEEIKVRLQNLAYGVGAYYSPPEHDSECTFCITYRMLNALDRYFNNDPIEIAASEAEKGYDPSNLIPRRDTVKPTIGRIVVYRSRTGDYECAAIISATRSTLNMKNVEKGYIPNLSDDTNVHLVVFSAGKPGMGRTAAEAEKEFLVKSEHGASANVSGTYQEFNISFDPEGSPGTWRWPTIE